MILSRSLLVAAAGLFLLGGTVCRGQLGNDDASKAFLASHCASSAGLAAEQFLEYASNMAKMLAHLTPEQQLEIFGFLPDPASGFGAGTGTGTATGTATGTGTGTATGTGTGTSTSTGTGTGAGDPPDLDGTPLEVSYASGNSQDLNDVFADALQAYWKMGAAAAQALTTGKDHDVRHNRDGWWDYNGTNTLPGDKTQAELEAELQSMASQLESDLASWAAANNAEYPTPWPPEMADLDDPVWETEVELPYLGP